MAELAEEKDLQALEAQSEDSQDPEDLSAYIAKQYSNKNAVDNFRKSVLEMVAMGKYKAVIIEIRAFQEQKNKTMPFFRVRSFRHLDYVVTLIEAIQELKSIPNFKQLPSAQQKKVHEQVFIYFRELNHGLKRIENVIHDLKVQDVRSTIWFLKTLCYCMFFLTFTIAMMEAFQFIDNPISTMVNQLKRIFFY